MSELPTDILKATIQRDKFTWNGNILYYYSKARILHIIGALAGKQFITTEATIELSDPDSIGKITNQMIIISSRIEIRLPPECQSGECGRCSGEYCETHFNNPCDCDCAERHLRAERDK